MNNKSQYDYFRELPAEEQIKRINSLTDEEAEILAHDWSFYARPNQQFPKVPYTYLLVMAGRGFGKTRFGAEWTREQVKTNKYVNIMGATANDARSIMVEGESGILAVCSKYDRPIYKKSDGELHWPNGAITKIFSADEPERLRGQQHMKLWCDEIGAWRYYDSFDQALFGLRLGDNPQACFTTTPRTTKLIKDLIKEKDIIIINGSTYDNRNNLAPSFFNKIIGKFDGTRLGRQELNGELLDKNENALWNLEQIDELRVKEYKNFSRIVVAIDPAVTSSDNSDSTGIVVAGKGEDGHYYVIEDLTMVGKPGEWATTAINAYYKYKADRIIAETNNGGDLVEEVIRNIDRTVSYKKVTATRGKILRAEPIAALYEQKLVHHIGSLKDLEDQMCDFAGSGSGIKSPDRLDAMVWGLTELSDDSNMGLFDYYKQEADNLKQQNK